MLILHSDEHSQMTVYKKKHSAVISHFIPAGV